MRSQPPYFPVQKSSGRARTHLPACLTVFVRWFSCFPSARDSNNLWCFLYLCTMKQQISVQYTSTIRKKINITTCFYFKLLFFKLLISEFKNLQKTRHACKTPYHCQVILSVTRWQYPTNWAMQVYWREKKNMFNESLSNRVKQVISFSLV